MTESVVVSNGVMPQDKPQDNAVVPANGLKTSNIQSAATPTSLNADRSVIADFFAHKNVFVTGGTGFLGTVLIEALLSATPDIGTIYVLVRAKRNMSPQDRIKRLTGKSVNIEKLPSIALHLFAAMKSF